MGIYSNTVVWYSQTMDENDTERNTDDQLEPIKHSNERSDNNADDSSGHSDEPTVTIGRLQCQHCSSTTVPISHDDCNAPIIRLDESWRCGSCGVATRISDYCDNCDGTVSIETPDIPLYTPVSVAPEQIERAVHKVTNNRRKAQGFNRLEYSPHLSAIALQHSRDMAERGFFAHSTPEGNSAKDRYIEHDHSTRSVGENLAKEYPQSSEPPEETAQSVVDGWMNSPGHRENLLRDGFNKEGIGVHVRHNGYLYITQNFY